MKSEQPEKRPSTSGVRGEAPAQYEETAKSLPSASLPDLDQSVASKKADEIHAEVARLLHRLLDVSIAFTLQNKRSDN